MLEDGSATQSVSTAPDFGPCPDVSHPEDLAEPGSTFSTCQAVNGDGEEVVGGNVIPADAKVVEWTR